MEKIVDLTDESHSIYNQIKRGDLESVKIEAGTHKRLANVPFKITSKTTGESHIVVTDKNGQFSTASNWASHKRNTNAGKSSEDGIWFGTSEPDDSKGALLYDTYEIEELACESNNGMKLIPAFEVVVSRNKVTIDLGTLTDEYEKEITIHTTATDKETGEKIIVAGKKVTIVDTVTLDGLEEGRKYQLKGWQMLKEENAELFIDGKRVESDYTFVADSEKMKVEVSYTFDASELGGQNLVTFEELYDLKNPEEPKKVAEHKDIDDEGQTVLITERKISIHTTATDKNGKKEIEAGKDLTIVDTVTLEGLEIATNYKLSGWQMVKAENAKLLIDGKEVTNDYEFTADKENMEVQIEFTFDGSTLGGKQLVTFEELYDMTNPEEPKKVTEHKDINDEGQTVTIKEVPETATPETPGTTTKTSNPPKTGDTANAALWIAILVLSAAGITGVRIWNKKKQVKRLGIEKEITIHTTATDKETGEKIIVAGKKVTIVDTVTLDGLEEGRKYQLKGWQMLKEENAELFIDGKRVESDYTFVADSEKMKVEVSYTFDASELGGQNLVTFEELYDLKNPEEPKKVAEHKDIDDEGQTVLITERKISIHTTATDKNGKKEIEAGKDLTIVDTVTLEGLEIATNYKLSGWQMVKAENAKLLIDGKEVTNDYEFTADKENMEVQIEFTFDGSTLGGKQLVTFEELYDMTNPEEPKKVTEHKDINDEGQTVTIKEVPETPTPETPGTTTKTSNPPKTGDTANAALWIASLVLSAAGITGVRIWNKKKQVKRLGIEEKKEEEE